jgi:hypothetical protein
MQTKTNRLASNLEGQNAMYPFANRYPYPYDTSSRSEETIIATSAPSKLYMHIRELAMANGRSFKTTMREVAVEFLEGRPWEQGLAWIPNQRPSTTFSQLTENMRKQEGNAPKIPDLGWVRVTMPLRKDLVEKLSDLAKDKNMEIGAVCYTMLHWWGWELCPPRNERFRRAAERERLSPFMVAREDDVRPAILTPAKPEYSSSAETVGFGAENVMGGHVFKLDIPEKGDMSAVVLTEFEDNEEVGYVALASPQWMEIAPVAEKALNDRLRREGVTVCQWQEGTNLIRGDLGGAVRTMMRAAKNEQAEQQPNQSSTHSLLMSS